MENIIRFLNETINRVTTTSLVLVVCLLILTHYYLKWKRICNFFPSNNIPGPKPKLFIGDFMKMISIGLANYDEKVIEKYGKIVGYYEASQPVVLCSDVDMIKHVMIKDSQYFTNRRVLEGLNIDPMDKWLSNIKNEEWKNVRSIISTTFTTGKLKEMFKTMEPSIDVLMKEFDKIAKNNENFNARKLFQKMTFDVIVSCGFGVQTDSINNPDDLILKNLKILLSQQLSIKVLLAILFPNLMLKLFKAGIAEHMPKKTLKFFSDLVEITINRRRNKEQYRNDFIQIMVEHEEKSVEKNEIKNENLVDSNIQWKYLKKSLTPKEILAQAILFLFAGSETSATTLSYVGLLLARHPDVQEKLYDEINKVYNEYNEINYEMLNEMEYLDMVIDETLRLFPAALRTDRECTVDYTYKNMKIPKGTVWAVSIWCLHHSSDIYPEPEKFIPERFSAENKKTRDSCSFIPFGAGPRICLGMRFAQMEMKLVLVKFLLKYKFEVCEQTPGKIETDNSGLGKSTVPIILKIVERK